MGLQVVAWRGFRQEETIDCAAIEAPNSEATMPAAIISRDMAEAMWPGQNPLGKVYYSWDEVGTRIVGVVDKLARPNNQGGPTGYYYSVMYPINLPYNVGSNYLLLTAPERLAEGMAAAVAALQRQGPNRTVPETTTEEALRAGPRPEDRG